MIKIPFSKRQTRYVSIVEANSRPQHMGKTILCTIDLSDSSKQAIEWAVTMAQQLKAHLTVLYTYRLIPNRPGEVLQLKKKIEDDAHARFKLVEKEHLTGKGISYDFRTEVGFVSDRIEDHAKHNNLNFVVMDKNMGANSKETFEELMEHVHVPMLLVP